MNPQNHFGKKVASLRVLAGMSQADMATVLKCTRVSASHIERSESLEDLSTDMTFRIYYLCQEIRNNVTFDEYAREQAKSLQTLVTDYLRQ